MHIRPLGIAGAAVAIGFGLSSFFGLLQLSHMVSERVLDKKRL